METTGSAAGARLTSRSIARAMPDTDINSPARMKSGTGHQRPGIERGERPLRRDLERHRPVGQQRRHTSEAHRERDRHAERQQDEQDGEQDAGHSPALSPPPAGAPKPPDAFATPPMGSTNRATATSVRSDPPTGAAR